jgi:anti-sigma-K factor RskA
MTMDHDDIHPDDEATMAALGRALPRTPAPPGLGDRIAASVAADGASPPMAEVIPIGAHRRRTVLTSLAAAACAAALAVGATSWVMGGSDSPGPLTASTTVVAEAGDGMTGTAKLYAADAPGGTLRVSLADVPAPPAGHHYEIWVLERGSDEMTAVGSFTPASRDVDLSLPLPAPADYVAVDISVEPNDGPPAHSGTSLAGAKFA